MNVIIPRIHKIRDAVNLQKKMLFERYGWKMNHLLTAGDIRLVLEILYSMGIDLYFKADKKSKKGD